MAQPRTPAIAFERRPVPVPAAFDDAVVWAAWLYYVDQLTQSEIAEQLGVSRATVVAMLQDARERGIVRVDIDPRIASRTRLSQRVAERWGLAAVTIVPPLDDAPLIKRLGEGGARALATLLRPGDVLGIAWGRTILAVAHAMPETNPGLPVTVVQVAGSSAGSTPDFSPELCASLIASRLRARCVNLFAPVVLSSPELRDRLMAEPSLVKQWATIRSANRILFGVGDLTPEATVHAAEITTPAIVEDYRGRGAVAAINGRFIAADGSAVPGELDGRMIAVSPAELKAIPTRLCVAGGPEKVEALRATLAGGYATHLVTDLAAGEALL